MTAEEFGAAVQEAWHAQQRPAAVLADFNNFDGSQGQSTTGALQRLHLAGVGVDTRFIWLDWHFRSRGRTTSRTDANQNRMDLIEHDPGLISGHGLTSAGNSQLNAMVMQAAAVATCKPTFGPWVECPGPYPAEWKPFNPPCAMPEQSPPDYKELQEMAEIAAGMDTVIRREVRFDEDRGFVNGDDSMRVVDEARAKNYCEALERTAASMGMSVTAEVVTEPWELTMNSCLFVPDDMGQWVAAPKPGRVLLKTAYKPSNHSLENRLCMIRGDALSLERHTSHVPVLRAWVVATKRLTAGRKAIVDDSYRHKSVGARHHKAGPETWEYMTARYGLTVEEMVEMEDELKACKKLPYALRHRGFAVMVERDWGLKKDQAKAEAEGLE